MSFFQRLRDFLGLDDLYDDYGYEGYEEDGMNSEAYGADGAAKNSRKVVGMPSLAPGQSAMILMQPQSFDEMPDAVTALRERRSVILDLTLIDVEHAQRCADYVAGGAFAMDGHYRQLGQSVFLFTPNTVHISHRATVENAALPQAAPPQQIPKKETSSAGRRTPIADPAALWNMP
jgi:cell division inhibitor SepF